jgi:WD40-like Beta Propeller Repeat
LTDSWVLLAVAPDGGRREQLTKNDISEFEPVASPDGARIAFVRDGGLAGHSPFPAGAPPAVPLVVKATGFAGYSALTPFAISKIPKPKPRAT